MKKNKNIYPVILSGGMGTRLWPLSRSKYPKQFIKGLIDKNRSLFQETIERIPETNKIHPPIIVCNEQHRFLVKEQLEENKKHFHSIILEPEGKNTAPAITIAALMAMKENEEAILIVQPSDHLIEDKETYERIINENTYIANKGYILLLGIKPTYPHTGYGYIKIGKQIEKGTKIFEVKSFKEKPQIEQAKEFVKSNKYLWNSGIFIFKAKTLIEEIKSYSYNLLENAMKAINEIEKDLDFLRLGKSYLNCNNISIDYAVIEKTKKAVVLPLNISWKDLGTWSSLWKYKQKDDNGNIISGKGELLTINAKNIYMHSERKKLIATIDIDNLVIVDTPDALLISKTDSAEKTKDICKELKEKKRNEYIQHIRDYRPWGWYEPLSIGNRYQVKMLFVKPGERLSMQMHYHRSEHWIVVSGTAKVTINEKEYFLHENESIYISPTQWHRLENPGKIPLIIIEVQIGTYLGEDDIERINDDYGRK